MKKNSVDANFKKQPKGSWDAGELEEIQQLMSISLGLPYARHCARYHTPWAASSLHQWRPLRNLSI